jgi:hypothetical protein
MPAAIVKAGHALLVTASHDISVLLPGSSIEQDRRGRHLAGERGLRRTLVELFRSDTMSCKLVAHVLAAAGLTLLAPATFAQSPGAGRLPPSPRAKPAIPVAPPGWTLPRTPWGAPDLQGFWSNATLTSLERPAGYGDRVVMTAEETAKAESEAPTADAAAPKAANPDTKGAAPGAYWTDAASSVMRINGEARASFVVEPKDGRIPALAPEAIAARNARRAAFPRGPDFGRGDNPESMTLAERCLKDFGSSSGPPMMPLSYNNTYQLVQTPTAVMIQVEMVHDVRIIQLTRDRTRPGVIQQWMGDTIGWYEGDTLVAETRNLRPGQGFRGADNAPIIEKWRRINDQQIVYSFEINDPKAFIAPLRAEQAWNATPGPIYEYACAEGNYSLATILGGERRADETAAEAARPAKGGKK